MCCVNEIQGYWFFFMLCWILFFFKCVMKNFEWFYRTSLLYFKIWDLWNYAISAFAFEILRALVFSYFLWADRQHCEIISLLQGHNFIVCQAAFIDALWLWCCTIGWTMKLKWLMCDTQSTHQRRFSGDHLKSILINEMCDTQLFFSNFFSNLVPQFLLFESNVDTQPVTQKGKAELSQRHSAYPSLSHVMPDK